MINTSQFLRFLLAGGLSTLVNFGSRFIFSCFFSYGLSIFLAYLIGMLVAFLLMRGRVFAVTHQALAPQILKFTVVNMLGLIQTLIISLFLAHHLLPWLGITQHVEALAHFMGLCPLVLTSYVGHKFVSFR